MAKASVYTDIRPPAKSPWRSIVVRLPINLPKDFDLMSDAQYERWERVYCNKRRLRVLADDVCKRFKLRKARVWSVGISRRESCHFFVYRQEEDSPSKRDLFKKVLTYVGKHAPKAGPGSNRRRSFQIVQGVF